MTVQEYFSELPKDALLLATDNMLERSPDITRIGKAEYALSRKIFPGLSYLANYVRWQPVRTMGWREWLDFEYYPVTFGNNLRSGLIRQNLALAEWFRILEEEDELDSAAVSAEDWLHKLKARPLRYIMKSYLQQERHEERLASPDEKIPVTSEMQAVANEYPALESLASLLAGRVEEIAKDEYTASEFYCGAMLGSVAIRELIELTNLNRQTAYVIEK